jgi:hypothetical protein
MREHDYDTYVGFCEPCGKRLYTSRKLAKQAADRRPAERLREYRCPVQPGFFHIGHLPQRVRTGDVTAAEHYDSGAS